MQGHTTQTMSYGTYIGKIEMQKPQIPHEQSSSKDK